MARESVAQLVLSFFPGAQSGIRRAVNAPKRYNRCLTCWLGIAKPSTNPA
jgi:hypothetical protein